MKRMLINATQPDELRVAITDNSQLIDLDVEFPGKEQKKANIYKAVISSIEPSLGAVFVNYGAERHGFLPLKEVSREYFLSQQNAQLEDVDINKVLKLGQELVVQIEKEERGTKGAALTTFISLAGSYLVLMPNNPRAGGISRRIEGDERDELRNALSGLETPEGMGVIVRTAGVGKSAEELQWDLKVLMHYWEAIKQAAIVKAGPYLIHQESDVIIRTIRDYLRPDIKEIIVDDPKAYERAKNYLQQVRPDAVELLKLYSDHLPMFSRFQVERQIEDAYKRELRLPSGGSLVIDHTEALISIDINSARATKGGNIEETAFNTNLEAADEIARQLRIRDIGGLIVIDFIDMTPTRNQREVENRLRYALRLDRARIQMGRISRFGLLEMSRQRLRASLSKSIQVNCPRCEGRGMVRGVESMALSIIHLIQEQASKSKNSTLHVQLPVDVATYMLNEKRETINDIETHSSIKIVLIPNKHFLSPQFSIKEVRDEHSRTAPSYKLARMPKADTQPIKKSAVQKKFDEPIINQFLSTPDAPAPSSKKAGAQNGGIIKKVWDIMFGSDESQAAAPAKKEHKKPRQQSKQSGRRSPSQGQRSQGQQHSQGQQRRPQGDRPNRQRRPRQQQRSDHRQDQRQQRQDRQSHNKQPQNVSDDVKALMEEDIPVAAFNKAPEKKTQPQRQQKEPAKNTNTPRTQPQKQAAKKQPQQQDNTRKNTAKTKADTESKPAPAAKKVTEPSEAKTPVKQAQAPAPVTNKTEVATATPSKPKPKQVVTGNTLKGPKLTQVKTGADKAVKKAQQELIKPAIAEVNKPTVQKPAYKGLGSDQPLKQVKTHKAKETEKE